MRRQIWLYAKWALSVAGAIAVFAITAALGGGCGMCSTMRVRMCDESVCGPFPACAGACECEEWNHRWCGGSGSDCKGTHIGHVPVVVYQGECDTGTNMCLCRLPSRVEVALRPKAVCTPCPHP